MKKLFLAATVFAAVCFGYVVGSTTADCSIVDHGATGAVAFCPNLQGHPVALDQDGVIWQVDEDYGWVVWEQISPVPVPVSEIKFFGGNAFITFDHHIWRASSGSGTWEDGGVWPGGASAATPTSWGGIKARHRN